MLQRKIQRTKRNSLLLTIPKTICDIVGIEKGTIVEIEYKQNKIVIAPVHETAKLPELTQASDRPIKESAPAYE